MTGLYLVLFLVYFVPTVAGTWKVFAKADEPGWAAIVPFYNITVQLRIIRRSKWWMLAYALPVIFAPLFVVAIAIGVLFGLDLAKSFGRSAAFGVGVGLLPFIFLPILGFGGDEYLGPRGAYATPVEPSAAW